jgi:hypothetical protein
VEKSYTSCKVEIGYYYIPFSTIRGGVHPLTCLNQNVLQVYYSSSTLWTVDFEVCRPWNFFVFRAFEKVPVSRTQLAPLPLTCWSSPYVENRVICIQYLYAEICRVHILAELYLQWPWVSTGYSFEFNIQCFLVEWCNLWPPIVENSNVWCALLASINNLIEYETGGPHGYINKTNHYSHRSSRRLVFYFDATAACSRIVPIALWNGSAG